MRRIALLVIATGRYVEYIDQLTQSILEHFFPDDRVMIHLFTDQPIAHAHHGGLIESSLDDFAGGRTVLTREHPIPSMGYPEATLYRYRIFKNHWDWIADADFVYYCDVDMRFVRTVADDALPRRVTGLVGVLHKYYIGIEGTFEERPESTAYVPEERRERYFVGGFNGGSARAFGRMVTALDRAIDTDDAHGIRAVWHDESHLNRYFAEVHPTILGPEYCWPEQLQNPDARLLCLVKPDGFR